MVAALHPMTSFAVLVLFQCYCLNLRLVSNVHHDTNFLIKSAGASPILSGSESVLLGFDLISVSMSRTGARPNINSNGVNLVESLLLVR